MVLYLAVAWADGISAGVDDTSAFFFCAEKPSASGAVVSGPGTPPAGTGSAQLTVDADGREYLATRRFSGTHLATITSLSYATWQDAAAPAGTAIALQLDVVDGVGGEAARLVFEPRYDGVPAPEIWQTWQPLEGRWWSNAGPVKAECPISAPCAWSAILAAHPDLMIPDGGLILLKAGGPWAPGFVGAVDRLVIGIDGSLQQFDFEATDVLAAAEATACEDMGWSAAPVECEEDDDEDGGCRSTPGAVTASLALIAALLARRRR